MPSFRYIARDLTGMQTEGVLQGDTEHEILLWLRDRNYTPVSVEPADPKSDQTRIVRHRRVRSEDMASLCWQLHAMIDGGVPITEALDTIAEDIGSRHLQRVILKVSENMKTGESFHDSLADYPEVFGTLFRAMIRAGEIGGTLTAVLGRLAKYYDHKDELARKIKRAIAYPLFVIGFVVVVIVAMMVFVIPRFEAIFQSFGNKLPAFTRAFIGFYHATIAYGHWIAGGVVLVALLLVLLGRTQVGRWIYGALGLHLPLIGRLNQFAFLATYSHAVGTLLESGVSILEAHDIIRQMTGNPHIHTAMDKTKRLIADGTGIALSLAGSGFFPPLMIKMVQVGEDSGSLPGVLERTSAYYSKRVDMVVGTLITLMEPILIVLVGAIILTVLLALYLPVFTMSDIGGG